MLLTIRRLRHDEQLTVARTRELIQDMKKSGRKRMAKPKRPLLPEVGGALSTGGLLCTFLPTVNQVQQAGLALQEAGYTELRSFEVLVRTWHITDRSVRPDHRMVGHTGFISIGRKTYADP